MKKKLGLLGCVLVMIASLLLLTACEDGTGNSYEFFQNIMSNVPVPAGCSEWKLLVADYDGDGRLEAFAFTGRPESGTYEGTTNSYAQWNYLTVYYISAGGYRQQLDIGKNLTGAPYNTTSLSQTAFRSFCTIGTKKYVLFNVGDVYGSCGYTMFLGANNGSPRVNYADGNVQSINSSGKIVVAGLGQDLIYQMSENGVLRLVDTINTDY